MNFLNVTKIQHRKKSLLNLSRNIVNLELLDGINKEQWLKCKFASLAAGLQ